MRLRKDLDKVAVDEGHGHPVPAPLQGAEQRHLHIHPRFVLAIPHIDNFPKGQRLKEHHEDPHIPAAER